MFAFHWPVNDWYSVPANDYLDKRRPEYAREEARGAIVYRRESGQSGGRVYFSPDCSLTIPHRLKISVTEPRLVDQKSRLPIHPWRPP